MTRRNLRTLALAVSLLAAAALSACGGGGGKTDEASSEGTGDGAGVAVDDPGSGAGGSGSGGGGGSPEVKIATTSTPEFTLELRATRADATVPWSVAMTLRNVSGIAQTVEINDTPTVPIRAWHATHGQLWPSTKDVLPGPFPLTVPPGGTVVGHADFPASAWPGSYLVGGGIASADPKIPVGPQLTLTVP